MTAMMELRDKLLTEAKNLREQTLYIERIGGYVEALENVAKDIDAQMLGVEKANLIAFGYAQIEKIDAEIGDLVYKKVPEEIYSYLHETPTHSEIPNN
jgi:hypothetical protein